MRGDAGCNQELQIDDGHGDDGRAVRAVSQIVLRGFGGRLDSVVLSDEVVGVLAAVPRWRPRRAWREKLTGRCPHRRKGYTRKFAR